MTYIFLCRRRVQRLAMRSCQATLLVVTALSLGGSVPGVALAFQSVSSPGVSFGSHQRRRPQPKAHPSCTYATNTRHPPFPPSGGLIANRCRCNNSKTALRYSESDTGKSGTNMFDATTPTTETSSSTLPTLDKYSVDSNGRIVGIIRNHPAIVDGDVITTSPLEDFVRDGTARDGGAAQRRIIRKAAANNYREGMTVTTISGSRYKLGRPKRGGHSSLEDSSSGASPASASHGGGGDNNPFDIFGMKLPRQLSLIADQVASNGNINKDDDDDDDDDFDPILSLPIMDEWRTQWNGRLMGAVSNHPVYDNGDVITTSALVNTDNLQDGDVVTTYSGSQYVLGRKMDAWKMLGSIAEEAGATAGVDLELPSVELPSVGVNLNVGESIRLPLPSGNILPNAKKKDDEKNTDDADDGNGRGKDGVKAKTAQTKVDKQDMKMNAKNAIQAKKESPTIITATPDTASQLQIEPKFRRSKSASSSSASKIAVEPSLRQRKREATRKYSLTGQTAGRKRSGGSTHEYLISGKPFRTTSGKSNIYTAYISDDDGLPRVLGGGDDTGPDPVAMKVSTNCEALKRENVNYDRIIAGGYGGRFVKKYEFIDKWGGPQFGQNACALVLEAGHQDLKSVMYARGGKGEGGLDGPAMRDAALAAARCVEAMHRVDLVWTDLKPENFIVTTDSIGCDGDCPLEVKGIDLESAIPMGETPVDYSPEASPPEFATDFHDGLALDHVLEFTYDIWSLGMLLYELSTGKSYFEHESPDEITQMLSSPDFKVDLRNVTRNRLRNLIGKCLQTDPKKRPSITEVLLHPYFLTTGLGWY